MWIPNAKGLKHLNSVLSQSSQDFYGIGATIRIGPEMLYLPYAGFLGSIMMESYE